MNIKKTFTDLKRYKDIQYQKSFFYDMENYKFTKLDSKILKEEDNIIFENQKE